ncbi:MAG TPA: type II toxin-antitoxin system VapC family toxin [Thermoanaerobaculia bacterium]|nr:type II toxin-antitoxin system VapC family toxin [Thermoanaerobaculia bacterium]
MSNVVLDASALLALLNAEPGQEEVERSIPGAAISAVNLSEVVAKLTEAGMSEEAVRSTLEDIEIDVHPFDRESAYKTGALRMETKKLGLSLGDRACIALGGQLQRPVLTTDRNWRDLELGVEIRVIR